MMKSKYLSYYIFAFVFFQVFASCQHYKKIPYFKDISDTSFATIRPVEFIEPTIQYDDIIGVSINTLDIQTASLNLPTLSPSAAGITGSQTLLSQSNSLAISPNTTYRVDKDGIVDFPLIGRIIVSGLTTAQLRDTLQKKFSLYYKLPVVDVRFINFRISVIGEVLKPGTYTISNEKINILEAIAMAGDLTIFGKRDNVLLIRDSVGNKQITRINLNSKSVISNPNFYLKQNDMVYVEPGKEKIANLDAVQTRYISIASSILSVLIILATRLR